MKKFLSLVLSVLMLMSAFSVAAWAQDEELVITVVNDLHYNLTYTKKATKANSINADFAHIGNSSRLPHEAIAIIEGFLSEAAENESQAVIIPGDITDGGKENEVEGIVELFSKFEAETGKQIYVVPGNHDYYNLKVTPEKFKSDYFEFGYDEAIAIDDDTASYVVDLSDEYRLIAIDSCVPGEGRHGIDSSRLEWIKAQGEKAKADGKKLIGMHHQNLLEHMIFSGVIQPGGVVTAKDKSAAEVYAEAGIKYVFTGHTHDHDIASYTAADGTVIYDAVTGSLNGCYAPYRVVTFGDSVKFETRGVQKIDTSLLPEGISANAVALAESNFPEYTKIATDLSYRLVFNQYTTAKGLKGVLKLEDEEMNAIIDKVGNRLNEALNMPLYKENETEEGKSIEAIVEKYQTFLPKTEYKDMIDLAVTIYQAHNIGDESFPAYSDEVIILTRGLAAVLSYALAEVSAEEYATVLNFIVDLLGVDIPVNFTSYTGSAVKRFEGAEILVTTVALPLVADFTTDPAPGDCNVTLPGYAELVEEEPSFLEKIIAFFRMLLDTVRTMFAFVPSWNK